jgi:hypothetical protein
MTTETHPFRPSRIWRRLPADGRLKAAEAFWRDGADASAEAQAIDAIARHLNFRHKSVTALAADRKARYLVSLPAMPDTLAARLLVAYHLAEQRPMMAAFLDALGMEHDNGVIAEQVKPPEAARIQQAARDLLKKFPVDAASVYLATLVSQDEETWGAIKELMTED